MGNTFCFPWELSLLQWMQSAESPLINTIAKFFSLFGNDYVLVLLVGLCFWCIDKRLGRNVSLAVSGSILFGSMIQGVFQRRRPYMDYTEIECLQAPHAGEDINSVIAQGYSFPSLHSTLSVGGYGTIAMNVKKKLITWIAVLLPLMIGLSRLYFGVHYPTDVLSGWVLGTIVMLLFWFLEKKFGYKICLLIQLIIGFFGFFYCKENGFYTIYGVLIGLLAGFWYEEKLVRFEMPKKWWNGLLRTLFGLLLFALVSALLKLPIKNLAEDEYVVLQFAYRSFRYALSAFVVFGPYTQLFKRLRFL